MYGSNGTDWLRNVTTLNCTSTVGTKSFYVDFANASNEGKSSKLTAYTPTTDEDVATGIFVTLYNYTKNTVENSITIESVKIEKAALPTPKKISKIIIQSKETLIK